MGNKSKKILSFIAAVACLSSTAMFASCGKVAYKGDELGDGFVADAAVESNGGFAVVKGDYVYFINGSEDYTADNTYGDVVKGALMRISKTDLANRNFTSETVKTVVPSLFVAQNFDAGVYIYGDTVYYATPTTRKNTEGEIENTYIDFKSAKLDGSEGPMKDYYLDLSSYSANYRFVEAGEGENKAVYLLYEEDGALKSHNTKTNKTTTLVSGSSVTYYYDTTNPENPNVYYTMSVPGLTLDSASLSYNQLYCVNAAATVTSVDAKNASYTVSNGKTYSFNKTEMEEKNKEAKENKEKTVPYDFDDYTTYPYVNLGDLVLDGVGINNKKDDNGQPTRTTQYNENTDSEPLSTDGYTYTVTGYANGGVYFTKADNLSTGGSDQENAKLYYLADSVSSASAWNVVLGNATLDVIANNTTNTASALFYLADVDGDSENEHMYLYKSGTELYRSGYDEVNGEIEAIRLAKGLPSTDTDFKFLFLDGDYLYYSTTVDNVSKVNRIDYTGEYYDYKGVTDSAWDPDYQAVALDYVEWNSAWYAPEIIGNTLLYSNAKAFGSVAYNYINAAKLGADNATIKADNEAYNAPLENIESEEYSYNADLQTALQYYYYTGETTAFDEVRSEYVQALQDAFDGFVAKFSAADGATPEYQPLSTFTTFIGKMTEDDAEAIEKAWADTLRSPDDDEDDDEGLPTWAIVLIVVGSVLVVAAAAGGVLLYLHKQKKAREAEAEATVNAYKRKIDVTDDKDIDVYADDEEAVETEEETAEEEAEEASETEAEKDE